MPLSVQRVCYLKQHTYLATHDNHRSLCPYLDLNLDQGLLNGYYGHFGVSLAGGWLDIEEKVIMKPKYW